MDQWISSEGLWWRYFEVNKYCIVLQTCWGANCHESSRFFHSNFPPKLQGDQMCLWSKFDCHPTPPHKPVGSRPWRFSTRCLVSPFLGFSQIGIRKLSRESVGGLAIDKPPPSLPNNWRVGSRKATFSTDDVSNLHLQLIFMYWYYFMPAGWLLLVSFPLDFISWWYTFDIFWLYKHHQPSLNLYLIPFYQSVYWITLEMNE